MELKSVHLGSVLLGRNAPMYVPTAALVTNLSVHFKQGAANSLVWVTTLEDARPVAGAAVAIADCHGNRLWAGTTDRQGLALAPKIDAVSNPVKCEDLTPSKYDFYTTQTQALQELASGAAGDGAARQRLQLRPFELALRNRIVAVSICRRHGTRATLRRIPCSTGRSCARAKWST